MNGMSIGRHALVLTALGCGLVACGGSDSLPIPTQPSPSVTGVSLLGPEYLRIGEIADFSMEAVYSDGSRGPMTALSWGTDNPAVAGMSMGRATGAGPGAVTLYGECQHGRASRLVRVVPDYRGSWAGAYTWRSCTASGDFQKEHACDVFSVGTELPVGLRLSQDRDRTTGTLALGDLMGDVTGLIDVPGHIALDGAMRYEADGVVVTITLQGWDTFAQGERMTGAFQQVWTAAGARGDMTAICELKTVTRTSQSLRSALALRQASAPSLRDLVARLGIR